MEKASARKYAVLWGDKKSTDSFIHLSTDQWGVEKNPALISLDSDSKFLHINHAFNHRIPFFVGQSK